MTVRTVRTSATQQKDIPVILLVKSLLVVCTDDSGAVDVDCHGPVCLADGDTNSDQGARLPGWVEMSHRPRYESSEHFLIIPLSDSCFRKVMCGQPTERS